MEFSESSDHNRAEKVQEAGHLLEEAWFFGNFLDTKTKTMSRCYSDPCPSSNCNQVMLVEKSKKKIPKSSDESSVHSGLTRAPSLPTSMSKGEFSPEKEKIPRVKKLSSRRKLSRSPSLPPCMMAREEDEDDQESEFTMGRLIRQASLSSSDMLPPRQHTKVITTQSISIPRQHSRKKAEIQSKSMEGYKDRRSENPIQSQEKIKGKSPSDTEFEELKGFKDLGLTFEKEDLNPGVVNMISGSQEKSRVDQLGEGKLRRKQQQQQPYMSESWLAKSPSPPPRIPGWVDKSSAEDMKAQIKFWARAVASNVRQEC